jgi:hypothetical protein
VAGLVRDGAAPLGLLGFMAWVGTRIDRADAYFYIQGTA